MVRIKFIRIRIFHETPHRFWDLFHTFSVLSLNWSLAETCLALWYKTCEKPAKGLTKNSSCELSFVLKVAPDRGKQYSEPKGDTLQYLEIQLLVADDCAQSLECNVIFHCPGSHLDYRVLLFDSILFLFFPGPGACQKRYAKRYPTNTQAIPLLKQYSHGRTSPKRLPSSLWYYHIILTCPRHCRVIRRTTKKRCLCPIERLRTYWVLPAALVKKEDPRW